MVFSFVARVVDSGPWSVSPIPDPVEEHLDPALETDRDARVLPDAGQSADRGGDPRDRERDVLHPVHDVPDPIEAVVGLVRELLQLAGQTLELAGHRPDLALHDREHAFGPLRGLPEREQRGDQDRGERHEASDNDADCQRAHRSVSMAGGARQVNETDREALAFIDFPGLRPLYSASRGCLPCPSRIPSTSSGAATKRRTLPAAPSASPASTRRARRRPASASSCSSTRAPSLRSIAWWCTRATISEWTSCESRATAWSPDRGVSTAGRSSCSRRTSRCSAARSPRPTRGRSARSWTWP